MDKVNAHSAALFLLNFFFDIRLFERFKAERGASIEKLNTDSVILKETIVDGKVLQTRHNLRDSTGTPYKWVTIPSIGEEGNKVSTFYSDRLTDSLVLSLKKIDTDSLITTKAWHPNGQLAWEFQMKIPGGGRQGLTTIYDENGAIVEQERYEDGELIEKIK